MIRDFGTLTISELSRVPATFSSFATWVLVFFRFLPLFGIVLVIQSSYYNSICCLIISCRLSKAEILIFFSEEENHHASVVQKWGLSADGISLVTSIMIDFSVLPGEGIKQVAQIAFSIHSCG